MLVAWQVIVWCRNCTALTQSVSEPIVAGDTALKLNTKAIDFLKDVHQVSTD